MVEKLGESKDTEGITGLIGAALSLLEKETWVDFFKKATDGIKNLFGVNTDDKEDCSRLTTYVTQVQENTESENKTENKPSDNLQQSESKPESNLNTYTNANLNESVVKKARDYIANGGTFHSPSKGTITWGRGQYKHVCSTGSYAVLNLLGIKNKSGSNDCDLKGTILPKMGLKYIGEVDPDNPEKNGYKPQDGDTAVWPRFYNGKKYTQHQATYIAGHWVSDTIQNKMSCYNSKNEPNVKIYRYTGEKTV